MVRCPICKEFFTSIQYLKTHCTEKAKKGSKKHLKLRLKLKPTPKSFYSPK